MAESRDHFRKDHHDDRMKRPSRLVQVCWAGSCTAGLLCFLGVILWTVLNGPPSATVSSGGRLAGKWLRTRDGRDIAAFEGIPYAAPPVGKFRFKDPHPAPPWSGVLLATEPGSVCVQSGDGGSVAGSEDCLYLNVYTPERVEREQPLDVLYYIHGGGWNIGAGHYQEPDFLLDRDIILVTINYRMGIFGFLSASDLGVSGNFGLKDAVAGLRWVKENIARFGGNPNSVTVAGQSAGSGSVALLMLSPLAKGLFHRAISMSGSALSPWACEAEGEPELLSSRLAGILGVARYDLTPHLMKLSAEDIFRAERGFVDWFIYPYICFKAVVEADGPDAFLTAYPVDLLSAEGPVSDVPYMTGITAMDGGLISVGVLTNLTATSEFNDRFEELAPISMMMAHEYPKQDMDAFMKKARKFYLGDSLVALNVTKEFTDFFTDGIFASPISEFSRLHRSHGVSPIFVYEFGFLSPVSFSMGKGSKGTEFGVSHGDELIALFPLRHDFPSLVRREIDHEMSRTFIDFIVTFANTGKPTRDDSWQAASDMEYMSLKAPNDLTMRSTYQPERMQFWRQLTRRLHPATSSSSSSRSRVELSQKNKYL